MWKLKGSNEAAGAVWRAPHIKCPTATPSAMMIVSDSPASIFLRRSLACLSSFSPHTAVNMRRDFTTISCHLPVIESPFTNILFLRHARSQKYLGRLSRCLALRFPSSPVHTAQVFKVTVMICLSNLRRSIWVCILSYPVWSGWDQICQ